MTKPIITFLMLVAIILISAMAGSCDEGGTSLNWQAYWVWGSENMESGDGYFRREFTADGPVGSAVLQGSGDDSYQLFVNGSKVHSGGFQFNHSDRLDITDHVQEGANVVAAVCHNAAYPGGWLAQLQIVYADGAEELVVTDSDTLFSAERQEGWTQVGFDDSGWERCRQIARPPAGIWGHLPVSYAGPRSELRLVHIQAPDHVTAGATLTVTATIRPMEAIQRETEVTLRLTAGHAILAEEQFDPHPPAPRWETGEDVTLGSFETTVSRYADTQQAKLHLSIDRCHFAGIGDEVVRDVTVHRTRENVGRTPARVGMHGGAPAMFIDGNPMPAMLYLQGRRPIPAEYAQMARAGYRVFSLPLSMGWVGPDKYDYSETDEFMLAALAGAPKGYFIPRVPVTAPSWWCERHPEELIGCADGTGYVRDTFGGTKHQSFASQLWRRQAGEALRRLIDHIEASPYADRIVGYHIASGIYGEWHLWSPMHLPDIGEPMREAFIAWCRRMYDNDLSHLNVRWDTNLESFEEITCATEQERYAASLGAFKDVSESRRVSDYWQCLHETTVGAINHFCEIVKTATDGEALAGVFYAYLTDIGWPQEGGHLAAHLAMQSPYIDFFCSPHSYSHRAMGEDGAFRAYPASIQLHGKLFIDEGDDRTHLSGDKPHMHAESIPQDIAIMRREALNAISNRTGMWWFDMTSGWFNDPQLLTAAEQLRNMGRDVIDNASRESWSRIAVVFDPTTYYAMADWKTGKDALNHELCNQQFRELQKMGAPYDVLLVDDLLHPAVRDYDCYIMLNTWHMTDARRRALCETLQKDGNVLLFRVCSRLFQRHGS